ncbi:hypothetical protein K2X33_10265 [bacterium]|nr:hypothetical protein [bacterium]
MRASALKFVCLLVICPALLRADPLMEAPAGHITCEQAFTVADPLRIRRNPTDDTKTVSPNLFRAVLQEDYPTAEISLINARGNVFELKFPDGTKLVAKTGWGPSLEERRLKAEFDRMNGLPATLFAHAREFKPERDHKPAYFTMRDYNGGSFDTHIERLGPEIAPLEMLRLFEMASAPLGELHYRGLGNGDFKASNLLVDTEGDGKIQNIVMTDVDSVVGLYSDVGARVHSIDYLDPDLTPASPFFPLQLQRRDMNALRIVFQEMALGKRKFNLDSDDLRKVDRLMQSGNKVYTRTYTALAHSPHSIDSRVHPVISAIAYSEFKSVEELQKVLGPAREAIRTGNYDRFFNKTLLPLQKQNLSAPKYAELIASSRELTESAVRSGSPWMVQVARNTFRVIGQFLQPVRGAQAR